MFVKQLFISEKVSVDKIGSDDISWEVMIDCRVECSDILDPIVLNGYISLFHGFVESGQLGYDLFELE